MRAVELQTAEEPAGIAQSTERRALGQEVMGSNLPAILEVTPAVASPYQGVKLGSGLGLGIKSLL